LELRLKQKDDRRSQWFNPLVIAVFTAALAAAGNALVAYINGTEQLRIEDSKTEASRILQVIRTNDVDKAKTNLEFLLKARLISSPKLRPDLATNLSKLKPGEGPSLPDFETSLRNIERQLESNSKR
jgi:hypothetical protein